MSGDHLDMDERLNPGELAILSRLEIVIEKGLTTFVKVGDALLQIRSRRLYRDTHTTFEDYCRNRWNIGSNQANKLIRASEVVAAIEPMGTTVPTSQRQARELTPLLDDPDELREAWQEVVTEHPQPTSKHVKEVVERRQRRSRRTPLTQAEEWAEKNRRTRELNRQKKKKERFLLWDFERADIYLRTAANEQTIDVFEGLADADLEQIGRRCASISGSVEGVAATIERLLLQRHPEREQTLFEEPATPKKPEWA